MITGPLEVGRWQVGDRVCMNVDRLPKAKLRERYRGVVGTVVARSISGRVISVEFPDGKTWQGSQDGFVAPPEKMEGA